MPIKKLVPAKLFDAFQENQLDASLISSIDAITLVNPEVVDGISISSKGDVYSVVMAYTGELQAVNTVALDPSSHTSDALLRIVLEEFHGIHPEYVQLSDGDINKSACLMIGDPAISFRKNALGSEMRFLDLGGEWFRNTGLPFVFALWALKNEFTNKSELAEMLRNAKKQGLSRRPAIAALEPDPDFALSYLTDSIRYDLGEAEKQGLELFRETLKNKKIGRDIRSEISYY